MLTVLRIVGGFNAAIWLGASVFSTFSAGPAFFSEPMLRLLGRPHAGAAAQVVLERYFLWQHVCGAIALSHLLAEWLYAGRPLRRVTFYVVLGVLALGLIGGLGPQPKLQRWHLAKYGARSTPAERQQADRSFRLRHGVSQTLNLAALGGIGFFFFQVLRGGDDSRFSARPNFGVDKRF